MLRAILLLLLLASPSHAFNALGHKVIADIAWQELDDSTRQNIVQILKRHPRFDDDFAKQGDIGDDRWIFQHAATWPDIARGLPAGERGKYDRPTWHYINLPIFVGGKRPVKLNTSFDPADQPNPGVYNVAQAVAHVRGVLASDAAPDEKAVAYCWLMHLVGDLHQPMHAVALVSERMPAGDRGGNSIPLRRGSNLHSLWDNLLGRQHRMQDVAREVAELRRRPELWEVGTASDVAKWIDESRQLAESFAYDRVILEAIEQPGDLPPIEVPDSYMRKAGDHARRRVVAAGLRLAVLLGGSGKVELPAGSTGATGLFDDAAQTAVGAPRAANELTHWLNLNGNVRHNSGCRFFENTKSGRFCGPDEGKPCGICGG